MKSRGNIMITVGGGLEMTKKSLKWYLNAPQLISKCVNRIITEAFTHPIVSLDLLIWFFNKFRAWIHN